MPGAPLSLCFSSQYVYLKSILQNKSFLLGKSPHKYPAASLHRKYQREEHAVMLSTEGFSSFCLLSTYHTCLFTRVRVRHSCFNVLFLFLAWSPPLGTHRCSSGSQPDFSYRRSCCCMELRNARNVPNCPFFCFFSTLVLKASVPSLWGLFSQWEAALVSCCSAHTRY